MPSTSHETSPTPATLGAEIQRARAFFKRLVTGLGGEALGDIDPARYSTMKFFRLCVGEQHVSIMGLPVKEARGVEPEVLAILRTALERCGHKNVVLKHFNPKA